MKNMNNNNKTVMGICNIMFFHIFHIHNSLKQWNLISDNTFHKLLTCKPCVGAKLVLRFQALITHTFLDRSILFLYRESACTLGSISRKWISFISRFGAIVSYFVRGDIFFDSPCRSTAKNLRCILLTKYVHIKHFWLHCSMCHYNTR